jgi:hypothetical protein
MALTITFGNHFKYHLAMKDIDLDDDTFMLALMATGFTFNKDTHHNWSDVSANEYADTAHGYSAGGAAVTTTVTEDDTDDRAEIAFSSKTWTASGAGIGPSPGAILYDDTEGSKVIVCYLSFGSDQTAVDGSGFIVQNVELRIA